MLLPLVAIFGFGCAAEARAVGRAETLRAIQAVENPRDSTRPGRHGELGAYQFRPNTWRMHTRVPFSQALNRSVAETVAIRHYEWIRRGLIRNGLEPSPYNIALAWNGGLSATVRGRTSAASRDYAARVENLARDAGGPRLVSVQ